MRIVTFLFVVTSLAYLTLCGCSATGEPASAAVTATPDTLILSRAAYADRLYGFWLGQCIGNWTGLITEMDKIGGAGKNGRAAGFYTREDWGGPDEPNLWNSSLAKPSATIDFVFEEPGGVWGADDDTDIEYIYQYLLDEYATTRLTAEQIRDGWLRHIYSDENTPFRQGDGTTPENYLWVSNQAAHDLMRAGVLPPATSDPARNPYYAMIDAQLTTEIFGLFAPGRPAVARELAYLPIRTTARYEAAWIAEFYVTMHALAARIEPGTAPRDQVFALAEAARRQLPDTSYAAGMYDFVLAQYRAGEPWETARDALHQRYQVEQADGYDWATRDTACNGCFAAGINFGASLVSLLYGGGDLRETIKIGTLAGWDSDNPTATWGGLLGFLLGKSGVEEAFGRPFADRFHIHRTRGGFPNDGIDTFTAMAARGVRIVDRVVVTELGGRVDTVQDRWYIPVGGAGR
jgi:hypothetical protein